MRLLPRMFSVEAQGGIRMKDVGQREPLSYEVVHELPGDPTPLATTADHPPPELAHLETKIAKTGYVAGNSMIVEVALYHAPQPFPHFRQWLMHEPTKCLPDLFKFGQESLTKEHFHLQAIDPARYTTKSPLRRFEAGFFIVLE